MKSNCKVGDLVHIPQAVKLIDYNLVEDPQLTIPLRVLETTAPTLGVITDISRTGMYVEVYCEGDRWAVKNKSVYRLESPLQ